MQTIPLRRFAVESRGIVRTTNKLEGDVLGREHFFKK